MNRPIAMIRILILNAFFIGAFISQGWGADKMNLQDERMTFDRLDNSNWAVVMEDSMTGPWQKHWLLDGEKATIQHSDRGMDFWAGPEAFNDDHHAVLWTQKSFEGDLKIEYEYTRLDNEIRMVNILYIQATGSGQPGFDEDIFTWSQKRRSPKMSNYFDNMNLYHISYAAFHTRNQTPGKDYIRGRRYVCGPLRGTELDNEYIETGMFETGVPHKIVVIKRDRDVFMEISNAHKKMLCHFVNSRFDPIISGPIGLRHMYTRGARYKNFKVSQLSSGNKQ